MKSYLASSTWIRHLIKMPNFFYAVAEGRKPGIYNDWKECEKQIHKYPKPVFKKFKTLVEAEKFVRDNKASSEKFTSTKASTATNNKILQTTLPKEFFVLGKRRTILLENAPPLKKSCSTLAKDDGSEEVENPESAPINDEISTKYKKTQDGFLLDKEKYVNVYTDGACSRNGDTKAAAGIGIWWGDNHPMNVSRAVVGRPTNNVAEIQAVTVAAQQAKKAGIKKLRINTDSQFLIQCITEWMPNWKRRGWKKSDGGDVINKADLQTMEEALTGLDISWNHVSAHVGIYGNEEADKLAKKGCSRD